MSHLATLLHSDGLLNERQVERADQFALANDTTFAQALLALDYVDERALRSLVESKLVIPGCDESELMAVPADLTDRIPAEVAWRHYVLPISTDGQGSLTVAMLDPTDSAAVDLAATASSARIVRSVAMASTLQRALHMAYGPSPTRTRTGPQPTVDASTDQPKRPRRSSTRTRLSNPGEPSRASASRRTGPQPVVGSEAKTSTGPLPAVPQRPVSRVKTGPRAALGDSAQASPHGQPQPEAGSGGPARPGEPGQPTRTRRISQTVRARAPGSPSGADPALQTNVEQARVPSPGLRLGNAMDPSSTAGGSAWPDLSRKRDADRRAVAIGGSVDPMPLSEAAFAQVMPQILKANGRDELTNVLLDFLGRGFDRVLLFVHSREELRGHDCRGGDVDVDAVRQVRIPSSLPSIFSTVMTQRVPYVGPMHRDSEVDRSMSRALDGLDGQVMLFPVQLGERIPLVLFAHGANFPVEPASVAELAAAVSASLQRVIAQTRSAAQA